MKVGQFFYVLEKKFGSTADGDIYYTFYDHIGRLGSFYIDYNHQGAVASLGLLQGMSLSEVKIPVGLTYQQQVRAMENNFYVSKAKEEGHVIVFKVTKINAQDSVEIEYEYR